MFSKNNLSKPAIASLNESYNIIKLLSERSLPANNSLFTFTNTIKLHHICNWLKTCLAILNGLTGFQRHD